MGSILGIEVRIHASWFVILLLILWTFSQGVFPSEYPGLAPWSYYVMGVAGALLFFASLLAHELAHSVVARRRGVAVEGITLFIFGGMARTRMESRRPGDEFVIAGVGPLSSFLLALGFGVLWLAGQALGLGRGFTGVAEYVAFLNLMLALFNLLPGFPLDGGRLLRSAVWKATGSLDRATRVAATGGTLLAWALIAYGGWQAFQGDWLNGLWLVFIGWFVRHAARSGYRQFTVVHALESVPAREAMSRWPPTVDPALTLAEVTAGGFGRVGADPCAVVGGDGRPVGVLTAAQLGAVPEQRRGSVTVADVMLPLDAGLQVDAGDSMARVLDKLGTGHAAAAGGLLVTGEGRLQGLITPADLAGWLKRARELKRL